MSAAAPKRKDEAMVSTTGFEAGDGGETNEADAGDMAAKRNGKSTSAFRTISEVAEELDVAQHVLRFWESKFPQVRPLKRGGGRRYYRPEDVTLLRDIRILLYGEGYTIKGAQKLLRQRRSKAARAEGAARPAEKDDASSPARVAKASLGESAGQSANVGLSDDKVMGLRTLRGELLTMRDLLRDAVSEAGETADP